MHKCFSYPLKAGNKEHILRELCPVVSSPAAVQRCATLRSPAPLSASSVRRWGSASPRNHTISYPSLHISSCFLFVCLVLFKKEKRKKQSPNKWGGKGFDRAVTPPRLTSQIIQVLHFMLRRYLFRNSLDLPLFGT